MAHWIEVCLPIPGTQFQTLVQEDSTCSGAISPCTSSTEAHTLEPLLFNERSHHSEKPAHHSEE